MANTRLEIGTNTNVGYYTDVPVNLIYQISDISKPDKRVSSGSLSITIPMSRENDILFENIFEANISLQTFNPHLKTAARYLVNELTVFKGYAQLLKINVDENTGFGDYEISLVGELLNIYTDINGLLLSDLDFSAYDHDLTYAQISGSWGASGNGFVYPIIDWGTNNSNLSVRRPVDFRACYFVREYLDKIFTDAGYTWTSSFLDGVFFSKLIIPPTKAPALDPAAVLDGKFLAVANGSQAISVAPSSTSTSNLFFAYTNVESVNFQTETYDQNNIFTTPNFTAPYTTKYNISAKLSINLVVTKNAVDVSANISVNQAGYYVVIHNVTASADVASFDLDPSQWSLAPGNANQCSINLIGVQLTAGNVYKVGLRYYNINLGYASGTGGTWALVSTIKVNSNFSAEFASDNVFEGGTVPGNALIPAGIKQTDFLTGIIKMFNLYMMVDKSNPKNYIIEPREDFYLDTPIDWTQKHDYNSKTEIKPCAELDAKDYRFTYKADSDYFNKLYSDYFKNKDGSPQVYGTHETSITNDFLNNINVTEVLFSPTPYGLNNLSEIIAPAILKVENNTVSEFNSNIRILYYSGQLTKTGLSWKFVYNDGASTVLYNSYPHAGHTDDPYAPTIDLNFGLPRRVYYTFPNLQWTTNNRFNYGYSRQLNQISDKNSRVVITDFYLDPTDVHKFDFRYPIAFIDKFNNYAYYIVDKFSYNPSDEDVTRVQLVKLQNYSPFTPTVYDNSGGGGPEDTSWAKVKLDTITTGPNNFNYSESSAIIGGNDNMISASSESCSLTNCSKVSVVGAENFIGSNIVGPMLIDSSYSNSTYNGNDTEVDVTSNTIITMAHHKKTLLVDCSGGDVTLTVDQDNCNGLEFCVIAKAVGANQIFIDSSGTAGTESYVGNGMPYDLTAAQYDTFNFKVIGDTIYNKE